MAYIRWSQSIWPLFLLIARLHPLNPLTYGPPPMYWLGTSRWCLGPICMIHSVWICFFLAFTPFLLPLCLFDFVVCSGWCLSLVVWRIYGFWGTRSLPFIPTLDWVLLGWKPSPSCRTHVLFFPVFVGLLAMDPTMPLHCAYYSITSLFYFLLLVGLWADAPTMPTHFQHLYFFWTLLANILVVPAHFVPWLPRPIYFFFTFFTPMGF